ncbi:hypothetical protein PsorP6_004865 [Peronosclerospora sorghi]|uniref:Uncharacterized protein n=1 Tax=Peronosclerospora sorghi TaxID=230839 RepID=A0ACC0W1F5_9STRA|nr:hypothetical protein PsorP6_004865 [Peronosclerospora sorghi]
MKALIVPLNTESIVMMNSHAVETLHLIHSISLPGVVQHFFASDFVRKTIWRVTNQQNIYIKETRIIIYTSVESSDKTHKNWREISFQLQETFSKCGSSHLNASFIRLNCACSNSICKAFVRLKLYLAINTRKFPPLQHALDLKQLFETVSSMNFPNCFFCANTRNEVPVHNYVTRHWDSMTRKQRVNFTAIKKKMLHRQLIHKHWAHSTNILFGSLERETRRIERDKRVPCRPRLDWAIEDRVVVEYKHIKLPFFSRRSKISRMGFERVFFSMAQTPTTYLDIIDDGEVGGDISNDTELILDIGSDCARSMNAEYK